MYGIKKYILHPGQGGKFVVCVKLRETGPAWRIGAQNFASDFGAQDKATSVKINVNNNTIVTCLNYLYCFGLWPRPYLSDFLKISSVLIHQVLTDRIWQAVAIAGPHVDILDS